jgi:exocyst complex component 4
MKRRVAKHRVHHHRRTSSALTAGLGLLAEKYSALSAECLRTLRVEMQFEAIYHLQGLGSRAHKFLWELRAEHGWKSLCH